MTSDRPLAGVNRVTVRNGSTFNAPILLFQDDAMSGKLEPYLSSSQYFKNWDVAGRGKESSYPLLVNPINIDAMVEIRIDRTDGSYETFNRTIPARRWWNSATDSAWKATPAARGWVRVYSPSSEDLEVFGTNRKTVLDGSTLITAAARYRNSFGEQRAGH